MRVLHVITGLAAGGAEQQLRQLLRHTRFPSEVLSLVPGGSVADALVADGVPVHSLRMRSNRDVRALAELTRMMRRGQYDVVHVHLYRACIYGRIAARVARVPVVVTTEHSIGDTQIEGRDKSRGVQALYLATERLGEVTLVPSLRVRERLLEWGVVPDRMRLVPIGLQLEEYAFDGGSRRRVRGELGLGEDVRVIGVVGRLEPVKQVDLAVRALAPLLGSDIVLLIVGAGSERAHLGQLVRALDLDRHVRFLGERPDVPQVLSALDLLVAPSREETFGLAVLEALASGLPVAYRTAPALDHLGVQPTRAHRVSGDPGELRSAVVALLATGPGIGSRTPEPLLHRYDIGRVAEHIDAIYCELRKSGRGPRGKR